jgi:hypothetical protein
MLSRQVAPLLRKFCKLSAYFTITTQRCHALTMLRSLKVILNFRTHAMWPCGLVPKLPARQQYSPGSQRRWSRQPPRPGSLWAFGECGRHGGKITSHLGAGIRHAQLTLKRPGLKKGLAQTFGDRARRNSDCPSPVNAIWRTLCLIRPFVLRAILLCGHSTTLRSSRERM